LRAAALFLHQDLMREEGFISQLSRTLRFQHSRIGSSKSFGDTEPTMSEYVPGTFYKRIWRPLACPGSLHSAISQEKLTESFVALRILLSKLETLFETVEPSEPNLPTYGHKIREILLLACMEVESSWSAILKENGYSPGRRFTTNDYVKLSGPMLLDGYTLFLQSYPSFPEFAPFKDWNASERPRDC
jgi:hypothetical protein